MQKPKFESAIQVQLLCKKKEFSCSLLGGNPAKRANGGGKTKKEKKSTNVHPDADDFGPTRRTPQSIMMHGDMMIKETESMH